MSEQVSGTPNGAVTRTAVRDYLAAIDEGRFEDAAALFTENIRYARPPVYPGEVGPQVVQGRSALLSFFQHRGQQVTRHELVSVVRDGGTVLGAGVLSDPRENTTREFLFRATEDGEGLIASYTAAIV